MTRRARVSLVVVGVVAGAAIAGCGTECTTQAVTSVLVTVTDDDGDLLDDATGTYWVDGDGPSTCLEGYDGELHCGYEVEGTIEVRIEREGYAPYEATVEVGAADSCHVETEELEVALDRLGA